MPVVVSTNAMCERLAQMLADSHSSVKQSYHFTRTGIDRIDTPCYVVFPEDLTLTNDTSEQEQAEQSMSIAYIGKVFQTSGLGEIDNSPEKEARDASDSAILYLLENQKMQVRNDRNIFDEPLSGLGGVIQMTTDRRSSVTLYTRDATEGSSFWGFTIDVTIKHIIPYELTG